MNTQAEYSFNFFFFFASSGSKFPLPFLWTLVLYVNVLFVSMSYIIYLVFILHLCLSYFFYYNWPSMYLPSSDPVCMNEGVILIVPRSNLLLFLSNNCIHLGCSVDHMALLLVIFKEAGKINNTNITP